MGIRGAQFSGGLPRAAADLEPEPRAATHADGLVEPHLQPHRVAFRVGAARREERRMESDATHRRREAAVHFLRGGRGHRGVREDRIRVGGDDILDGAAVEADGVGVDADPVGVRVRRLHRVREDHAAVDGGIVARLPLPRPDGQFDRGRPDHPHGFVEPDVHGNRLGQLIGVPAVWTGHDLYPRLPRGIHQTSIHFAIGIGPSPRYG